MKTQKQNGLHFSKGTIVELNSDQLNGVNGGGVTTTATTTVSCAAVAVSVTLSQMAYDAGEAVGGAISRLFD